MCPQNKKNKTKVRAELKKSTFEARYTPQLRFLSSLSSTAAELFPNYEHWKSDGLSYVLNDTNNLNSLLITSKNFAYEQDSSDTELENKYVTESITNLTKLLDIESFVRFGLRRRYLAPVGMSFNELVTIFNLKLFSQDNTLKEILPTIDDLMYRVNAIDDKYKINITIGPVEKAEIPNHIKFNQEHHLTNKKRKEDYDLIIEKYPEVAMFFDIDFYLLEDELTYEDGLAFFAAAKEKTHDFVNNITNYLIQE